MKRRRQALEKLFNASANDILSAIQHGFRAQVDVKGKLAELYLFRILKDLQSKGKICDLKWNDKDGEPDFTLTYHSRHVKVECKNLRSGTYKGKNPAYKVEIQKTRNSKDGSNTRSYKIDYFDVLAVCLFNQSGKWEFRFARGKDLERVENSPQFLKIMHKVPIDLTTPWHKDILEVLQVSGRVR